jgi:hypothetical protein
MEVCNPRFCGGSCCSNLVFYLVFCKSVFVLLSFLFWSLYCLSFDLWLLITTFVLVIVMSVLWFMASYYHFCFGHCKVCPMIYGFLLPLLFWSLYCLSYDLWLLITTFVLVIVMSVLWFMASYYHFCFGHCNIPCQQERKVCTFTGIFC